MGPCATVAKLCLVLLVASSFLQDVQGSNGSNSSIISSSPSFRPSLSLSLALVSTASQLVSPSMTILSPNSTHSLIPSPNSTHISPNSTVTINPNVTVTISPNMTHTINPNVTHTINPNVSHTVNPNVTSTSSSNTTAISSGTMPVSSTVPPTKWPTSATTAKGKSDNIKKRMWVAASFAIVFGITTLILGYLVYRQRRINRELEGDPSTARLL